MIDGPEWLKLTAAATQAHAILETLERTSRAPAVDVAAARFRLHDALTELGLPVSSRCGCSVCSASVPRETPLADDERTL